MKHLAGMNAALFVPTYGPVDSRCAQSVIAAVMHAAQSGLEWKGHVGPNRVGWSAARNMGAKWVYETPGVDGMVWVDSDMKVPTDAITRLLDTAKRFNADFVTGVYHQRMPFHNPVFYNYNPALDAFQPAEDYPENTVERMEAGGCGFGFVYTSRKLITDIRHLPSFTAEGGWFPDTRDTPGGKGEDLAFCSKAIEAGYPLFVDTGIQLGHAGESHIVTREDFLRERVKITPADVEATHKGWL